MKKSIFFIKFLDGKVFESQPCEWLDEAIIQSGRRDRPVAASFLWGDINTPCTQRGIDRAMEYLPALRAAA